MYDCRPSTMNLTSRPKDLNEQDSTEQSCVLDILDSNEKKCVWCGESTSNSFNVNVGKRVRGRNGDADTWPRSVAQYTQYTSIQVCTVYTVYTDHSQ